MSHRPLQPRSKSQASEIIGSNSRVGSEARRPVARRPEAVVETRDSFTQTEGDDLGDPFGDFDEMCDVDMEVACERNASREDNIERDEESPEGNAEDSADTSSGFLSQHIRMQAELEMALRSQMEMIAEVVHTVVPSASTAAEAVAAHSKTVAPQRPVPMPPQTVRPGYAGHRRPMGLGRAGRASREGKGGLEISNDGSDGECHPEDDEVTNEPPHPRRVARFLPMPLRMT